MAEAPGPRQLMEQAVAELRRLKLRVAELEAASRAPVAIVGLGCRFPGGADSPDAFWSLLRDGGNAIREVPRDRWDGASYHHPDPDAPGTMYTLAGGFLDRVDTFDAGFFNITPREATALDPQQRLLLEVAWEALEHAAIAPDRLFGTPGGVFVGISSFDFALRQAAELDDTAIDAYFGTGNALSVNAGRLAYLLGLEGPAIAVDTSCSSSLVAIHLACQSLRAGECAVALAGGVNVMLAPEITLTTCRVRALSPSGRSAAFAAGADGYVRGEGCGVVVLKRLADARRDGDRVLAVIRGSAINHDGHTAGLTVPNGQAQQRLMRQALANAGVTPEAVSYVEAHGTGTPLGDPIELGALGAVYGARREPLVVGAVKANIGHLEAAAGIAGLIKVVLALGHGEIPPQLHAETPSPLIPWATLPVEIPRARRPWIGGARERLAGLSSFGFSGTNVHLVVSEAPREEATDAREPAPRPLHVLALSARGADALDALAARYGAYLAQAADAFADVCYTAGAGRRHFAHRLAVVARDAADARARLATGEGVRRGEGRGRAKVAARFTGDGARCAELADLAPVRAAVERCAAVVAGDGDRDAVAGYAVACGLADLWRSWGVRFEAVSGDGAGEHAAAYAADGLDLEDGARLVASRGVAVPGLKRRAPRVPIVSSATLAASGYRHVDIGPDAGWASVLDALAQLYVAGVDVDWGAVHAGERRRRLSLPTYPFRRQRYWPALAAPRRPRAQREAAVEPAAAAPASDDVASADLRAHLERATDRDARQLVAALVTEAVAHVSGLAVASLDDPHAGFFDLGLNSLMVVELRNRLEQTLALPLPPTITFDHPSVAGLGEHLVRLVRDAGGPDAGGTDADAAIATELRELEKLLEKPR